MKSFLIIVLAIAIGHCTWTIMTPKVNHYFLDSKIRDMAAQVCAATGSRSQIAGPPAGEPSGYVADLTRARTELGYEPTIALAEGLQRYVAWLQATR